MSTTQNVSLWTTSTRSEGVEHAAREAVRYCACAAALNPPLLLPRSHHQEYKTFKEAQTARKEKKKRKATNPSHLANGFSAKVRRPRLLPLQHVRQRDDPEVDARQRPQVACLPREPHRCTHRRAGNTGHERDATRSGRKETERANNAIGIKQRRPREQINGMERV